MLMNEDRNDLMERLNMLRGVFSFLGLLLNSEKSVLNPVQALEYLGVMVDSRTIFFSLPREKIERIRKIGAVTRTRREIKLRYLASILGSLQ